MTWNELHPASMIEPFCAFGRQSNAAWLCMIEQCLFSLSDEEHFLPLSLILLYTYMKDC